MESDRRTAAPRKRMLKEGKLLLSEWSVIDCVIRDMSETGARVALSGPMALPDGLRLLVVSSNELYPVRVAWQRGQMAGLQFTGPPGEPPARKY